GYADQFSSAALLASSQRGVLGFIAARFDVRRGLCLDLAIPHDAQLTGCRIERDLIVARLQQGSVYRYVLWERNSFLLGFVLIAGKCADRRERANDQRQEKCFHETFHS